MLSALLIGMLLMVTGSINVVPSAQPIDIVFAGDTMMDGSVKRAIARNGPDFPFRYVKKEVTRADLAVANLETSITQAKRKDSVQLFNFKSNPSSLQGIKHAGFDLVSMANNHVLDYMQVGLMDTFKSLNDNHIQYMGAGKNEREAYSARTFLIQGQKVKIAAFSRFLPSGNWFARGDHAGVADAYDPDRMYKAITREREGADYLIVYIHWGVEKNNHPEAWQREMARKMLDSGADAIVGSHPHVLQGFEIYKGKPIAYSIGNFLFPDYIRNRKADTGLLHLKLFEGQIEMSFTPYTIRNNQVIPRGVDYKRAQLKYLEKLSYGVKIKGDKIMR
ncbi:CapA family protein [Cohnella abietis]|uniref:Capsular polysaccharide biosynthesis protein n=1 Tax=Cohnella abietis TaxID=2507935 RepID=A0A3T1D6U9_9BACL|nr:CapA family protein [Cohnella abietis]BBI33779.1 capsular polysaccharide biosynthesis protein [Cohnella abietis]